MKTIRLELTCNPEELLDLLRDTEFYAELSTEQAEIVLQIQDQVAAQIGAAE